MTIKYLKNLLFSSFLLLLIMEASSLNAQTGTGQGQGRRPEGVAPPRIGKLQGTIIDSQSREPLMFASVVLNRSQDSTMVSGAITNEAGRFVMEELPPGMYFITVNFIGYPRKNFNGIRISMREPEVNMGTIEVEPAAQVLSEVTVEAERSLMETGLDRRVINVAQELTAIGGTGLDIMQNIPSVAVDFDGNVSLRGSSNVTILIDGRPSTLTGLTGTEALEQIPAELIERVEIITNPSARYNPEGTSGIINVVLKKQRRPGYNGMASLNAGSAGSYSGSLNFNYKYNRWNFFTNVSGRLSEMKHFGNTFRETQTDAAPSFMNQDMRGFNDMQSVNAQLGVDYSFNRYNTLTLSSRYSNWDRSMDNITQNIKYLQISNPNQLILMDNQSGMINNSFNHQVNFRRTFKEPIRELTADMNFSTRKMDRNERILQEFFTHDFQTPNGMNKWDRSRMDGNNWSFSSQVDYVHPLGKTTKFETGARIQANEIDSDFQHEIFSDNTWTNNPRRSNHFIYNQQIYSIYGIYASIMGNYSLQAGLRAEQTFTEADQKNMEDPVNKNQYLDLFPTVHLRRNFTNNRALQLSYSRRVNRPNNRNINPFVRYDGDYDVSFGNPNLKPEYINSLELGYTHYWKTTTLNPSIFYRHTAGMISRYRTVENIDSKDVTVNTFSNLNKGVSYGSELIVSQRFTSWFNMNGTFSYFRSIIDGAIMEREADSYSWSARMVGNVNIPRGWNMQVTGFYRSPIIMLQGEMDAMYSASAGVRKNIWGNTGTISLNVSDIFNTMRFSMYNYGDNFSMNSQRWRTSRIVTVGFTYRINETERRNNRRQRDRDNDSNDQMDFDNFDM
jgi:outer membrane receptor protein involved in Fe transport